MENIYEISNIGMYAVVDGEYIEIGEAQEATIDFNEPFVFTS